MELELKISELKMNKTNQSGKWNWWNGIYPSPGNTINK